MDALAAAPALARFRPLPHRLQPLGERDGWHWVNDSISTTPLATLAALESLHGRAVTVLVGGHDRGLDWTPFVEAMRERTGKRDRLHGRQRRAHRQRAARGRGGLSDRCWSSDLASAVERSQGPHARATA